MDAREHPDKRGPRRRGSAGRRDFGGDGSPERVRQKQIPETPVLHLSDEVVKELRSTARPGKGEILVKVFSESAGAFTAEQYDEAIRLGEQAKHIALRSATVRELLGLAYYRTGKWREAARELAAFRRISGSTDQNPVIADCHRALGRPEKAVEICAEIDDRAPPSIRYEGAIVAAGALADMKRLDEAIARLEQLDLRPAAAQEHHLRAWYVLADLLERKGRFTQAREWFEAVAAADPDLTDASDRVAGLGHGGS